MLSAHLGNRLLVELHRLNEAQAQAVLVRNAQGCARAQNTFLHVDTDNDRGLGVEAGVLHHLQDAREDSFIAVLGLSFQLALFDVGGELVEQVIDDLSGEDLDALFVSNLLGLWGDTHIEGKDNGKLLLLNDLLVLSLTSGFHSLEDVLLMNWTDSHGADRNLGG